jgi:hypothetical protein
MLCSLSSMTFALLQVMNNLAVQFLSKAGGSCDKKLPGYSMFGSLGHTKDVQVT